MSPEHAKAIKTAGKQIGIIIDLVTDHDGSIVRVQAFSWPELIAASMKAASTSDHPASLIQAVATAKTYDLTNAEGTAPLVVVIV